MATLRTNYKDDILAAAMDGKRQYQMIQNGNGTVSFVDVTDYTQNGDTFTSGDVNGIDAQVNTNTTNIATNAGNISTNAENIASNTQNISNLSSRLSTDEGKISTNTTNIANLSDMLFPYRDVDASSATQLPQDVVKEKAGTSAMYSTGIYRIKYSTTTKNKLCLYMSVGSSMSNQKLALIFGYDGANNLSFSNKIYSMCYTYDTWTEQVIS